MEKEKKNKTNLIKNVAIILLVIIVLVLTFYIVFSKINVSGNASKAEFLRNMNDLQKSISFYLGKLNSDTFDVYNENELAVGFDLKDNGEKEQIKDGKEQALKPIADFDKNIEKNTVVAYQLNETNIKELIGTELPDYDGIVWYIQNGKVKISYLVEPEWWTNDFTSFLVGND